MSLIISVTHQISASSFIVLSGPSQFKFAGISHFAKFSGSLLRLVEVVIHGLDSLILVCVFLSLHCIEVLETTNLFLITSTFFFQLTKICSTGIDFSAKRMAWISLLSDIFLSGKNLWFSSWNLFSGGSNLCLELIIASSFVVGKEAGILYFLLKTHKGNRVRFKAGLEVIVL